VPAVVEENIVSNCGSYGMRIEQHGSFPLATVAVRRNRVTMPHSASSSYAVSLTGRIGLLTLHNNTVQNGYYGVYYGPNLNTSAGDTTRIVADSNAISGTGYMGLYLYISTSYTGSAIGTRNNISNNFGYGIYNSFNKVLSFTRGRFVGNGNHAVYSSYAFDATQNWWGVATGPGGFYGDGGTAGDSVSSGIITWDPYLTSDPTDVPPLAPPAVGTQALPVSAASVADDAENRLAAVHERARRAREERLARGRGRE
jgi:hypothetical protein